MAKISSTLTNGQMYNEFGDKIGVYEEAFFGDSFNRSAAVNCCYVTPTETKDIASIAQCDTLADKISAIEKQLEILKENMASKAPIRAQLKTLKYNREVK